MGNVTWKLPPTTAELLEAAQDRQIAKINAAYTAAVQPLIREYPEPEPLSWAHQDAEAQAYLAWHSGGAQGDAPATPVLDQILAGRNGDDGTETMMELCEAVERNAVAFRQAQVLTGKRQRLVRLVREAETEEAAGAIEWPDKPGVVSAASSMSTPPDAHADLIDQLNAVHDAYISDHTDDESISRADAAKAKVLHVIPTLSDPENYDVEIAFHAHLRRQP